MRTPTIRNQGPPSSSDAFTLSPLLQKSVEELLSPTYANEIGFLRKTNAAKDASVHSGWLLKRKKKKGKVSGWKKRFIDVRTDSITYAKEPGKAVMGTFDLFYCQVRPAETQEKTPHFLLATGDALYDFAIATSGETLEMWSSAIETQRTKLFTLVNENYKPAKKEPSGVLRAPVRKNPQEGEKLFGEVLVDALTGGADWPSRWFEVADGFMYIKASEAESKALIRLRLERFVSLDLVNGPPELGKCIAMTIDGDDILFCPGSNHSYWVTGFSMLLRRYRPDAYAKFQEATNPKPPARTVSIAPPVMPFRVGEDVYAVFVDDGLWYKAVIDSIEDKVLRVTFTEYGNSQDCTVEMIRSLAEVAKMSAAAAVPSVEVAVTPAAPIPFTPREDEDLPEDLPPPPLPAKPAALRAATLTQVEQVKRGAELPRVVSDTIHSDDVFMQFVETTTPSSLKVLNVDEDEVNFSLGVDEDASKPSLIDRMHGGQFSIDQAELEQLQEEQKRKEESRLAAERAELEAMNAELAALQEERAKLRQEQEEAERLEEERLRAEEEAEEEALRQQQEIMRMRQQQEEEEQEEERRRVEEEERLRVEEEARIRFEEEQEQLRVQEEARRLAEEAEQEHHRLEEEARREAEEVEQLRLAEEARRVMEEERLRLEEEKRRAAAEVEKRRLLEVEAERARQLKQESEERARKLEKFQHQDDEIDDNNDEEAQRLAAIAQAEAATREKLRLAKERAESIKSIGRGGGPPVKAGMSVASSTGRGSAPPEPSNPLLKKRGSLKWPPDPIPADEPEEKPAAAVVPPPKAVKKGIKMVKKMPDGKQAPGGVVPPKKQVAVEAVVPPKAEVLPEIPRKPSLPIKSPRKPEAPPKKKDLPDPVEEEEDSTRKLEAAPKKKELPDPVEAEEEPPRRSLPLPMDDEHASDEEMPPLPVPEDETEDNIAFSPGRELPQVEVEEHEAGIAVSPPKKQLPQVVVAEDEEEEEVVLPPPKKQLPPVVAEEESAVMRISKSLPVVEDDDEDEEMEGSSEPVVPPKKQLPPAQETVVARSSKGLPMLPTEEEEEEEKKVVEEVKQEQEDVPKEVPRKKSVPPPLPPQPRPGGTGGPPPKKPIPHAPSPVSVVSNLGSAGPGPAGPSRSTAVAAALERARLRKEQANK